MLKATKDTSNFAAVGAVSVEKAGNAPRFLNENYIITLFQQIIFSHN
jgi:hypothetical protein